MRLILKRGKWRTMSLPLGTQVHVVAITAQAHDAARIVRQETLTVAQTFELLQEFEQKTFDFNHYPEIAALCGVDLNEELVLNPLWLEEERRVHVTIAVVNIQDEQPNC